MRLLDYVVSCSLRINNQCLRYLAEFDLQSVTTDGDSRLGAELATLNADNLLARDSRRLVSLWWLTRPCWQGMDTAVGQHLQALEQATQVINGVGNARQLALRLASRASQDADAEAIMKVARCLPADVPLTWDALNEQFTQDSGHWRSSAHFRGVDDGVLERRMLRSYKKAYRRAREMPEQDLAMWLDAQAARWHHWLQLAVYQLEVLRPGLSESGKAQLWYMDKLADTLRTRAGLVELMRQTETVEVKKSVTKQVTGHVAAQIKKMDKRVVRLAAGAFAVKPKRLRRAIAEAVCLLDLGAVRVIHAEAPARSSDSTDSGVHSAADRHA